MVKYIMYVKTVKRATATGVIEYYYLCRKFRDKDGKAKDEIIRRLEKHELDSVNSIIASIKNEGRENIEKSDNINNIIISNLESKVNDLSKKAERQYKYILELESKISDDPIETSIENSISALIDKCNSGKIIDPKDHKLKDTFKIKAFSEKFLEPLLE